MISRTLVRKGEARSFHRLGVVYAALVLAAVATPGWSQSTATGTVSGQVTDQQHAVIGGAEVKMNNPATGASMSTTTNDAGRYSFLNVPPATYDITVSKMGFSLQRVDRQQVEVGQVLTINAVMEVGSTTTTVEVTAAVGAELQTTNATVGQTLTGQSLVLLPNLGREAAALTIFQPGVSPEGAVAGAMYDQNTFQLDGGNNSNDMDGSMNTYTPSYANNGAPTGVMPTPIESIEEFKVATSGMTADFNGSSGSQVQMVTKRGTNAIHGAGYEYYFASDMGAANSWDNNHTPSGNARLHTPADHPQQPLRRRFGRTHRAQELARRQVVRLRELRRFPLSRNRPSFPKPFRPPLCAPASSSSMRVRRAMFPTTSTTIR